MTLPAGATFAHGELKRIEAAVEALANDHNSPRELTAKVILHVHHEYPKHIVVGKDKNDNPITKVVNSKEEELAAKPTEEEAE